MNNINTLLTQGSNSISPDLDWSQVRETVRLLNLAISHIEESMHVGEDSVDALTDSFTTMAGNIQSIQETMDELPESKNSAVHEEIKIKCDSLKSQVHTAIMAFQFYDRMIQKLSHVSHSMDAMGELIVEPSKLFNPHEWIALQEKIRSRYTMESERVMFDTLMTGATVKEALEAAAQHDKAANEDGGEIDLF